MAKQKVFISFDYDNDFDIKVMLAGQAKLEDSPFDFIDASVKDHLTGDWKDKVKKIIAGCDQVVVLCGEKTHSAAGVSAEIEIARELKKPYFLLTGRAEKTCYKPKSATSIDKMYTWSWRNLKALIGGTR